MLRAIHKIIHDMNDVPNIVYKDLISSFNKNYSRTYTSSIYERFISTLIRDNSSTHSLSVYEEFSYGFFGVICLAFAIIVHINNSPDWYIKKTDRIINYAANFAYRFGLIKDDVDKVLPLYTPLETVKNINNKSVAVDIYDYTIKTPRYKMINKVEDV